MNTTISPPETTFVPWYVEGAPVFASTSEQVGVVDAPPVQGGHLAIVQGSLFIQVRYLPLPLVRGHSAPGVYLTLSKAQVQEEQWKTLLVNDLPCERLLPSDVVLAHFR
jgi:hypothetical protein